MHAAMLASLTVVARILIVVLSANLYINEVRYLNIDAIVVPADTSKRNVSDE